LNRTLIGAALSREHRRSLSPEVDVSMDALLRKDALEVVGVCDDLETDMGTKCNKLLQVRSCKSCYSAASALVKAVYNHHWALDTGTGFQQTANTAVLETILGFRKSLMLNFGLPPRPRLHTSEPLPNSVCFLCSTGSTCQCYQDAYSHKPGAQKWFPC
jgi:hypothetical protein